MPGLALAQTQTLPDAPPPPDIDDPGVVETDNPAPLETLPPSGDGHEAVPTQATRPSDDSAPEVNIVTRANGDVVEEYRVNGRLSYVKVTPKRGISYTLRDTNNDGRLDSRDSDAPVHPVYFTLYEWD
ncbi:MAG: hypothetical protein CVV17_13460 [Gammaproteobacteria bacterium HGW-Gammaproteobacteria-7]|nr:MAG: hypothetical protein CVV17_13460 [Gammaproteobacteria bacterium HGW-Gammaproteobacteria-7]